MRTHDRSAAVSSVLVVLAWTATVLAQDKMEDLASEAANPIANLMSIPFQNNTEFALGPYDRTANVLNVQPVVPLAQGKVITRTIFPFTWVPDVTAESGMLSTGISDILFTAFYVPGGGTTMWGIGPVLELPTGGEIRGSRKWSAGVSAVVLAQPGPWTVGLLANNVWSFAGDSDAAAVNKGILQYFIVYQLGNGWYLNSAPIIAVNWKAPRDKWRVPLGAGGGKLVFLGKLPVNLQSQAYYYLAGPDEGPDWQLRFQVQVLLPVPGAGA